MSKRLTLARLARAASRIERLRAHLAHQMLHTLTTNYVSADFQLIPEAATAVERPLQINLVNLAHQHEVVVAGRSRSVVRARPRYLEQIPTPYFWQRMLAQDQFATLTQRSRPSTSNKNRSPSPADRSSRGVSLYLTFIVLHANRVVSPKTSSAPLTKRFCHSWIWFGWTPNCSARSASGRSPFGAATATFALNAGQWIRRFLVVVFCSFSLENVKPEDLTYPRPVSVQRAGSISLYPRNEV